MGLRAPRIARPRLESEAAVSWAVAVAEMVLASVVDCVVAESRLACGAGCGRHGMLMSAWSLRPVRRCGCLGKCDNGVRLYGAFRAVGLFLWVRWRCG